MSSSPPSTALRTPSSTPALDYLPSTGRSARTRKPVKHFGSVVNSDQVYGVDDDLAMADEEEAEADGDFAGLGGESSEEEGYGYQEEDDEEGIKKGSKKATVKKDKKHTGQDKKRSAKASQISESKKLAVVKKHKVFVELASAKKKAADHEVDISKGKPASNKSASAVDKSIHSDEETSADGKTAGLVVGPREAKGKREGIVLAKTTKPASISTSETPLATKANRLPSGPLSKKSKAANGVTPGAKPIVIGAKSTKARAGVQLAPAKKPAVTIAPAPAQSDEDSGEDSAKRSAIKAKIRSRAVTPAVPKYNPSTGSSAECSSEEEQSDAVTRSGTASVYQALTNESDDQDQAESQLPAKLKKAINTKSGGKKAGKQSFEKSFGETADEDRNQTVEESPEDDLLPEAASPLNVRSSREASMDDNSENTRASCGTAGLSRSASPDLIVSNTDRGGKKRKTAYEESQAPPSKRGLHEDSEEDEVTQDGEDQSSSSQSSSPTLTPTPKKSAKRKTVTAATKSDRDNDPSSTPSKKSKPAPAEKILPAHRVAIIEAFVDKSYLSVLNFGAVSKMLADGGVDCSGAKLGRHWREVLSSDIKQLVEGSMSSKTNKTKKGGGIGVDERQAIWVEVVKHYDKANWKRLESETGISTVKLKRHLRDVLDKDVKKFISQ